MKNYLDLLLKNPLLMGSITVFFGSNFVNFLNYIYHLFMGRLLGPSHYGELAALFSLMGLLMMVPGSASLTIIKFVSSNKTDEETQSVVNWFYRKAYLLSGLMFLIVLLLSPLIGNFLHISVGWSLLMIPATILFGIPTLFNRSILQGLLNFNQPIISVVGENLVKLGLGVFLVYLGFALSGAIIGVLVSAVVGWALTLFFLKKYMKGVYKQKNISIKKISDFTIPVLVQSIAATSLISTDIVLVKHFFSAYEAGLYASISTLGKVIFFCSGPIGTVMFPLVSKRYSKKENYYSVLFLSLGITLFIALILVFLYFLFPEIAINLLYGSAYLSSAHLLGLFGLFIAFYTVSSLLTSFYLSLGKTFIVIPTLVAGLVQFIGIWFFHESLQQVIMISIYSVGLLMVSLVAFLFYEFRRYKISNDPS